MRFVVVMGFVINGVSIRVFWFVIGVRGAIALHSTLNDEGSVSYFGLQNGRPITRTRKTPLPMPAHAIDRVKKNGETQNTRLDFW